METSCIETTRTQESVETSNCAAFEVIDCDPINTTPTVSMRILCDSLPEKPARMVHDQATNPRPSQQYYVLTYSLMPVTNYTTKHCLLNIFI
ncbi:hypothetical protein CDAR_184641 [Caerostris darwini]|uniref:Uncharacterized protein n=1 Tax=Caerostris darwini TaxID=1538125 RepID=A0AAV4PKK1_9ARAC|nr:hypothetical protein CDAR_184641 [Caerostris darwini]